MLTMLMMLMMLMMLTGWPLRRMLELFSRLKMTQQSIFLRFILQLTASESVISSN